MATTVLDGTGELGFEFTDGVNYGCAGRETFDPFSTTMGKQVDIIDKQFYTWKKCVQCATQNQVLLPYHYDAAADSCGK